MQQILTAHKGRWFLFIIIIAITSCNKVNINFGNQTITDPNALYVDTFTYRLTTFQADSFVTSGTSNLMIGMQNDTAFGKMSAETYFQLGTPGANAVTNPVSAILDSAKIRLLRKSSSNFYGDTTSVFSFGVYQLTEQIQLQSKQYAFYNTNHFNAQTKPIATFSTIIKPFSTDSIVVPLDISITGFAGELFDRLKNNDVSIQTLTKFLVYQPGFVIKPLGNTNAVYSFNGAVDSGLTVRLYYHYPGGARTTVDFPIVNASNQFNRITVDRTNTPLTAFTPNTTQSINSQKLANKGYLQTAGNLKLKIDFPGLRQLRTEVKYKKIISAILYIKPYGYRYNGIYALPPILTLYTSDLNNTPVSAVLSSVTGSSQSIAPVGVYAVDQFPYYAFDVSGYITSIINGGTDIYNGLTLESPNFSSNSGIDRLVLADPAYDIGSFKSIQIKLYALTF